MITVLLLSLLGAYYIWTAFVQPRWAEEWAYEEGFRLQHHGTYGIAQGGHGDKHMIRVQDLDHRLLPGGKADAAGKRRLIFVGDIHGCKQELLKLLKKANFNEETDHLILVGDTVTKGPDSAGVLDELIRLNATSVRGNHEDRLIHLAQKMHARTPLLGKTMSSKGATKDAALLRQLKPHHLRYLRAMPLILRIPVLPMASGAMRKTNSPIAESLLVVHAGLVPGVHLAKQDPWFAMNMRSIHRRTHVPSALRDAKNTRPWYDVWCWYNDRIFQGKSLQGFNTVDTDSVVELVPELEPEAGHWSSGLWKNLLRKKKKKKSHHKPQVVVYGHDSKSGLQIKRWSKGLDSACVSGGKLTAMVLDAQGRQELVHVGCENYRE